MPVCRLAASRASAKAEAAKAAARLAADKAKTAAKATADKAAAVKAAKDPTQVAKAIETLTNNTEQVKTEIALQKELEKELIIDAVYTNKLVKGDFSPTNTNREKLIVE